MQPEPSAARVEGPVPSPDPRVEAGRSVLARFGYAWTDKLFPRDDYPEMWALLLGDFHGAGRTPAPAWHDLVTEQQDSAREYMDCRLVADRRYDLCSEAQNELYSAGIGAALVEKYTTLRDSYEDSVEAFGAARERLQALLDDA